MMLYKYFPEERSSFLEQCLVRFTPADDFNDLFEGRGQYEWIVPPQQAVADTDANLDGFFDQALLDVYEKLPEELKRLVTKDQAKDLLVSSGDVDGIREGLRDYMKSIVDISTPVAKDVLYEEFCKHLGIFCLSENPTSHTMWGYYTNHKGFVVGFDAKHKFFDKVRDADRFMGRLHKVTYLEALPRHQSIATMRAEDMFLTKKQEWQHEAEWRMLDGLQFADQVLDGEPPIHLFRIPAEAVSEIVFGYRSSRALRQKMIRQKRSRPDLQHITIVAVEIDETTSSLKLVALDT